MKKKKSKNKKRISPVLNRFYPILIMCICLFMGFGYAAVNSKILFIDGDVSAAVLGGIVISDVSYKSDVNANYLESTSEVVTGTLLNNYIVLSDVDDKSSITFNVTLVNNNPFDCQFSGGIINFDFYDNDNIDFVLSDDIKVGDLLTSGSSVSFDITFKYKDGVIPSNLVNSLNGYVYFEFNTIAVLKASSVSDSFGFRSSAYKNKIKTVNFGRGIDIPNNAIGSWDIGTSKTGDVIAFLVSNSEDASYYDLHIQSDTQLYANEDMSYWFYKLVNVDEINGLDLVDTSKTTNMVAMFRETGYNSTEFVLDVGTLNTSKVTDMSEMFFKTGYSSEKFTLDLKNFNTSNLENMYQMFYQTGYKSPVFQLNVSTLDTSRVTNMRLLFCGAGFSNPDFVLDVSNFNTGNVTSMNGMFSYLGRSSNKIELDVKNFNTSKVTDMSGMFREVGYNNNNFVLDLSNFDTSNVVYMDYMFAGTGYNSEILEIDLSNFNTKNVTNMANMFSNTGYNNTNFTLNVSNFDTSNVTDMSGMFYYTGYKSTKLTLDLSGFDTKNVTNMSKMFSRTGFKNPAFTLNLGEFDTSNVLNMQLMFNEIGYSSTKMDFDITIRNPNVENYSDIFKAAAVKSGTRILVNYTNDTSDLVDLMINTKSSSSNVFKGYNLDNQITFSIGVTNYTAYEGMTWRQWVNSDFNTGGFYIPDLKDNVYRNYMSTVGYSNLQVSANETIVADRMYTCNDSGSYD